MKPGRSFECSRIHPGRTLFRHIGRFRLAAEDAGMPRRKRRCESFSLLQSSLRRASANRNLRAVWFDFHTVHQRWQAQRSLEKALLNTWGGSSVGRAGNLPPAPLVQPPVLGGRAEAGGLPLLMARSWVRVPPAPPRTTQFTRYEDGSSVAEQSAASGPPLSGFSRADVGGFLGRGFDSHPSSLPFIFPPLSPRKGGPTMKNFLSALKPRTVSQRQRLTPT